MEPNPTKNKNKNKNTRKKDFKSLSNETQIKLQNNALITEYNYYTNIDKKWLPTTSILEYMKREYKPFYEELEKILADGKELSLDDFFIIPNELSLPQTKCSFETNLKQNPTMSFDKFISIPSWQLNRQKTILFNDSTPIDDMKASIKDQVSRDITRIRRIEINNKIYYDSKNFNTYNKFNFIIEQENTSKKSIDENTDLYNKKIMNLMNDQGIPINFNSLNIIDILSQQNILNLLQMNIELFILKKIAPEYAISYKFRFFYQFFLTKEEQYMLINVNSKFLLNKQGDIIITPCGNYSASLRVDLKNKSYSLENFILNYDIINCGTEEPINSNNLQSTDNNSGNVSQPSSEVSSINKYKNKAYNLINNNKGTIAAGVATSGLVSVGALYLAGILGGKSNNFTCKRRNIFKQNKKNNKPHKFTNKRLKNIKTKKYFTCKRYKKNKKNKKN
jgi:hypothetical protein